MAATKTRRKTGQIREQNRQLILDAAEQEFVLHGFKGTSMQAIADRAGLPKANIHYYFKNKENLYTALLAFIIDRWNEVLSRMREEDDPAEVLEDFIRAKMELAYSHPRASKIYAMEIVQGAPHLKNYIRMETRQWVRDRVRVMETWIAQGKMRPVDPVHLIFLIWSSTQHYADFESQILTVMNRAEYEREDIDAISDFLCDIILRGCGLERRKQASASV